MNYLGVALLITAYIGIPALLAVYHSSGRLNAGRLASRSFLTLLVETAARYAYIAYVVLTAAAFLICRTFSSISNHSAISLDIIFFITVLILVKLHRLEVSGDFSRKTAPVRGCYH